MSHLKCILCLKSIFSDSISLNLKVNESLTLEKCIEIHIPRLAEIIISAPNTFHPTCSNCFTEFATFYEFLALVDNNYGWSATQTEKEKEEDFVGLKLSQLQCIICYKTKRCDEILLRRKVNDFLTLQDCIEQHIPKLAEIIINEPKGSHPTCFNCFKIFSNFYQFLALVDTNYNWSLDMIQLKEEKEQDPLENVLEITEIPKEEDPLAEIPPQIFTFQEIECHKIRNCSVILKKLDLSDEFENFDLNLTDFDINLEEKIKITKKEKITNLMRKRSHHKAYHRKAMKPMKVLCEFCSKIITKNNYKKHFERMHAYEKEVPPLKEGVFQCQICDLWFSSKHILSRHTTVSHIKTSNWPFGCDFCEKRFYNKIRCQEHIAKQHTNDFPWKCDICDKKYQVESSYYFHRRTNHPELKEVKKMRNQNPELHAKLMAMNNENEKKAAKAKTMERELANKPHMNREAKELREAVKSLLSSENFRNEEEELKVD